MNFEFADRIKKLPPYLFIEIDRARRKALSEGKDIIDLGVGDPDLPTPQPIIEELYRAARDPKNHRYSLDAGLAEFRKAIAQWYARRFGVSLKADTEILPLIGSKEGIGHIPLAFINPGDRVLVPEPGYPVYQSGTWFAGGEPVYMSLLEKNNFLPCLAGLSQKDLTKAKMMFINYPNNPTGATASLDFFKEAVQFAKKNNILVCHDAAYTEVYYEEKPHSFLEAEGAKEIGIEFHSLSKTYNMTGWRIGFAVGHAPVIQGLAKVKSNVDSGIFQAIQWAGIRALSFSDRDREELLKTYRERRDVLMAGLKEAGWKVKAPKASFYIWASLPEGTSSKAMALRLLSETGIVATPGVGFGVSGEGYIRFSITVPVARIREAVLRLKKVALV
ncbi:MAG: LL-diaminopimelate aminotransferase [Chlamydiae bacterium]|nr:LL-diaminopimelate aminotransferase [Chlamydiota bacterium]MBI3265793.1 LL-diaminopimelate aminotransferase [Chlamydiota bacterium]